MTDKIQGINSDTQNLTGAAKRKDIANQLRNFADEIEKSNDHPNGVFINIFWEGSTTTVINKRYPGFKMVEAIGSLFLQMEQYSADLRGMNS